MADLKLIALSTLYVVLAMILVSLGATYQLTYKLFGGLTGSKTQSDYALGMKPTKPGFIIHVIVFALLVAVPMFLSKK